MPLRLRFGSDPRSSYVSSLHVQFFGFSYSLVRLVEVPPLLHTLLLLAVNLGGWETQAGVISPEEAVARAEQFVAGDRAREESNVVALEYGYDQSGYWVFFDAAAGNSDAPYYVTAVRMRPDGSHIYREHQLMLFVESVADTPQHCQVPPVLPQLGRMYPRPGTED